MSNLYQKIVVEAVEKELRQLLDKYEWFYEITIDSPTVLTVWVDKMDKEVSDLIPEKMYNEFQIKLGFYSYLTCKEKYGAKYDMFPKQNLDYENS